MEDQLEQLYLLKVEVERNASVIPRYYKENNIPSKEEERYKESYARFVALGRQVFGDMTLSAAGIKDKIESYALQEAKNMLLKSPEEAYSTLVTRRGPGAYYLDKLEVTLNVQEVSGEDFSTSKWLADEREFLAKFTPEELASFRRMQDYIRSGVPFEKMTRP